MNIHIFISDIFFNFNRNFVIYFVRVFKKEFKWILDKKDETPNFNKNKLNKFYNTHMILILGGIERKIQKVMKFHLKRLI